MKYEELVWSPVEGKSYVETVIKINENEIKINKLDEDSYQIFVNDNFATETDLENLLGAVEFINKRKSGNLSYDVLSWEEMKIDNPDVISAYISYFTINDKDYAILKINENIYELHTVINGSLSSFLGELPNIQFINEFLTSGVYDIGAANKIANFELFNNLVKEFDKRIKENQEVELIHLGEHHSAKILKLDNDSYKICIKDTETSECKYVEVDRKWAIYNYILIQNQTQLLNIVLETL